MTETATESQVVRWGIMSTASIAPKNWQAIHRSGNGKVVAVASRSLASSQQFIADCQAVVSFDEVPRAIEGYDELLAADDIDAVYIPLPTGLRHEWVIKAAQAGKHVMCEKPCADSLEQLTEMVAACEKNNVQFMDGVMYMHAQRMNQVREAIDQKVGKIKRIATQFSFFGGNEFDKGNIRTNSKLECFGCLGDLGWYTIRFTLWAMNYQAPVSVTARMLNAHHRDDSPDAVPMEIDCFLDFGGGTTATFYNSFINGHQQWAHVSGTEGFVHVPDFVLPYEGDQTKFSYCQPAFDVNGCDFVMTENRTDVAIDEAGNSAANSPEANLFRRFGEIVLSGEVDSHWPKISLLTQRVLDACLESAQNDGRRVEFAS
ncbi:MAG: putative dehydrogenase [Mariniblastus sp.]